MRRLLVAALAGLIGSAAPASAQSIIEASDVLVALDFAEDYESHVDWVVDAMTSQSLIGGADATAKDVIKLQYEVRQYLIDEQPQVTSMLALGISQNRDPAELTALREWLAAGRTLDELPHMDYWLRGEIYAALSGHALVVAMGSGGL